MMYIKLNAGNDVNGNPRRVFVILNEHGTIIETINEGYNGMTELRKKYSDIAQGPTFETSAKEYKRLCKFVPEVEYSKENEETDDDESFRANVKEALILLRGANTSYDDKD